MRRRFLIFCLLAVLVVGAVTAWHYRARLFPQGEVSALFLRYEHQPGIEADFIKNYRLNDSTAVDVTYLTATDSAGWNRLKEDFNIHELLPIAVDEINQGGKAVTLKLILKDCPGQPSDTVITNNDAAAVCREQQSVCVFHIISEKQYDDIVNQKLRDITINNKSL